MEKDLKQIVKDKYTEVVTAKKSCCEPSCCSPVDELSFIGDSYENLEGYVADADYGLGCGIPTETAGIRRGDTVLDLGSGAGNDVFVARQLVGPEGFVIGVDMTEAMIARANQNKQKLGYDNVEFRLGDIEDLPLPDNTIDVAISNCVLNLVPDKVRAYAEIFRVLKPGGHFSISDVVLRGELTPELRDAAVLYAGCVSGALQRDEYLGIIQQTGFANLQIVKERAIDLPDELLLEYISSQQLAALRAAGTGIFSVTVTAEKGAAG